MSKFIVNYLDVNEAEHEQEFDSKLMAESWLRENASPWLGGYGVELMTINVLEHARDDGQVAHYEWDFEFTDDSMVYENGERQYGRLVESDYSIRSRKIYEKVLASEKSSGTL